MKPTELHGIHRVEKKYFEASDKLPDQRADTDEPDPARTADSDRQIG